MQENHDVVIVRDVDTRLFPRDKNLVDDWVKSPFKYHICRDNQGSVQPILAGLWGGKQPDLPISETWEKWVEKESGLTWMTKDEAMAFVEKIAAKVKTAKNSEEAFILTKVITADLQLNHYNNREKTKVNLVISRLA